MKWLGRFLVLGLLGIAAVGFLRWLKPKPVVLSTATEVRSAVTQLGDSLQVVVSWRLTPAPEDGRADSVRVEVGLDRGEESRSAMLVSSRLADTAFVPAPLAGRSAVGYSCVAAQHGGTLKSEACTPWQYVRAASTRAAGRDRSAADPRAPGRSAADRSAAGRSGAGRATGGAETRLLLQPDGLQVDPDVGGKCAEWQRWNPGRSVWEDVNRKAVPDCTGPNGRPVVAQFCALAELPDGRRILTANAQDIPYCRRLLQEWERQRYS